MSKLFKLKKWLTVSDAAKHLSIAFGEDVSEADVLQLALDAQLRLSVYFVNHTTARRGKMVPLSEARKVPGIPIGRDGKPCDPYDVILGLRIFIKQPDGQVEEKVVQFDEEVFSIEGVWDLTMIGGEKLDIEHKYQMMTGGVSVELVNIDGTYVSSEDGQIYQLLAHYDDNPYANSDAQKKERTKKPLYDPDNYYPAGGLPDDAVLVVRTKALSEFESRISESEGVIEKPLTASERESLLKLVIGMAMKGYSYDPTAKKNSAVADIAADLALLGLPLGDDTIRKYLKQGNEQLPAKPANT